MGYETGCAYYQMARAAADGITLPVESGFRTNAEQTYLYNCYVNQNCNSGNKAAEPGTSAHQSLGGRWSLEKMSKGTSVSTYKRRIGSPGSMPMLPILASRRPILPTGTGSIREGRPVVHARDVSPDAQGPRSIVIVPGGLCCVQQDLCSRDGKGAHLRYSVHTNLSGGQDCRRRLRRRRVFCLRGFLCVTINGPTCQSPCTPQCQGNTLINAACQETNCEERQGELHVNGGTPECTNTCVPHCEGDKIIYEDCTVGIVLFSVLHAFRCRK